MGMSKVKKSLKADKWQKNEPQGASWETVPGGSLEEQAAAKAAVKAAKPAATNNELPGMIGSLEQYATLVGKSVGQLAESKYEPPDVSESDSDEGEAEGG